MALSLAARHELASDEAGAAQDRANKMRDAITAAACQAEAYDDNPAYAALALLLSALAATVDPNAAWEAAYAAERRRLRREGV